MPKISVLMPVYNGERYLREAIESILTQSFTDFELILVDDGSTDGTSDILDSYNDSRIVRLHHEINQGLITSLNQGLKTAKGEFVARQDADDISLPDRLKLQVQLLDQNSDVVIVGSAFYQIDEYGTELKVHRQPTNDTNIRWHSLFHCSFAHTSVMLRTNILRQHSLLYSRKALHAEDFELWSRLLHYGQGANIEQPLVKRRAHTGQVSKVAATTQRRTGDSITQSNLQRLGIHISPTDVSILRGWYNDFPQRLQKQDMRPCEILLQILDEFGKQENLNQNLVRSIRRRWIGRILNAINVNQLFDLWASGLLKTMLHKETPTLFAYASKQAKTQIKETLQIT